MAIDIFYGLRNLSVGDEEETRIDMMLDDIDDAATRAAVEELVARGEYEKAYALAIRREIARQGMTRTEIERGAEAWLANWNDEQGYTDDTDEYLTVAELMAVYDEVTR